MPGIFLSTSVERTQLSSSSINMGNCCSGNHSVPTSVPIHELHNVNKPVDPASTDSSSTPKGADSGGGNKQQQVLREDQLRQLFTMFGIPTLPPPSSVTPPPPSLPATTASGADIPVLQGGGGGGGGSPRYMADSTKRRRSSILGNLSHSSSNSNNTSSKNVLALLQKTASMLSIGSGKGAATSTAVTAAAPSVTKATAAAAASVTAKSSKRADSSTTTVTHSSSASSSPCSIVDLGDVVVQGEDLDDDVDEAECWSVHSLEGEKNAASSSRSSCNNNNNNCHGNSPLHVAVAPPVAVVPPLQIRSANDANTPSSMEYNPAGRPLSARHNSRIREELLPMCCRGSVLLPSVGGSASPTPSSDTLTPGREPQRGQLLSELNEGFLDSLQFPSFFFCVSTGLNDVYELLEWPVEAHAVYLASEQAELRIDTAYSSYAKVVLSFCLC